MEVTDKNFEELLPQIEDSIDRAIFLGIDCEYSGLKVTDEKENYFESLEDRYQSVRSSTSNFLVVQFGLCPFFYDEVKDEFTHEGYNFYTFPKQAAKGCPNMRFVCETASLEFLAGCGFDFNKMIYRGIPHLTCAQEDKMKQDVENRTSRKAKEDSVTPIPVPEAMKKFVQSTSLRIQKFSKSGNTQMELDNLSPFQRKLIFHNVKPHHSELYFETIVLEDAEESAEESPEDENQPLGRTKASRSDSQSRVLRITKLDKTEQKTRELEKRQEDLDSIARCVGFSKVVRKISSSGKLIVGHNALLDITHTIHQFLYEIPNNLADFKIMVQAAFPNLIDTKHMSSTGPFRELIPSHVLYDLAKRIQQSPFQLPKIGLAQRPNAVGYEMTDRKRHEAGFDAFTTGCCFIALSQYMGVIHSPPKPRVLPSSPLLLSFMNKLYVMRMVDIAYLNISGRDLSPSRSHVFYVTCPNDATQKDIMQIFSPFGNIQTYWRTNSAVFVALNDKDQSSLVMPNIEHSSAFRVFPFATYEKHVKDEKKRPLQNDSPERAGDVFKKLVSGGGSGDKSPPEQKKKRPKTEAEKKIVVVKQVFAEPTSWD